MIILGINCFSHDTSASLLTDGEIIAFAEEERFVRKKHTKDFPNNAIKFCLDYADISIEDVDYVAFPFRPGLDFLRGVRHFLRYFPRSYKRLIGQTWMDANLKKKVIYFRREYRYKKKIFFVGHHEAHAASSFFVSPFDQAAILSIDRGGDFLSTLLAIGEGSTIKTLKFIRNPHSVGEFYTALTAYLGFTPNSGEGKVMGLAPYGDSTYFDDFQRFVSLNGDGGFEINLDYFPHHYGDGWFSKKFVREFGVPRHAESEMERRFENIAAALQRTTEDVGVYLADHLHKATRLDNLCIAGGVGLNSVMNAQILQNTPFKRVFIQPACNDAGTSLGCALYVWHVLLGNERSFQMKHAFYGPEFSNSEIKEVLQRNKLNYQFVENPAQVAARLVADGKIVGWFQGRMEMGPRALGGRSILADPRVPEMKDILNHKVKHREGFRPFAPSILVEDGAEYFDNYVETPFMLKVLPIKEDKREVIPAVCHVDGTGRLQTVSKEESPQYWELINEFKKITGVPVVLNTSFNVRGEPIVLTPQDAINCFLSTQLDCLVIGNHVVDKKNNRSSC
jgi:carbamoyltransferase